MTSNSKTSFHLAPNKKVEYKYLTIKIKTLEMLKTIGKASKGLETKVNFFAHDTFFILD